MHAPTSTSHSAAGLRIAIAASTYHTEIMQRLRHGAKDAFIHAGGNPLQLTEDLVPGSFELVALVATLLADHSDMDAIVALGCILTGETRHDEYLSHAVTSSLATLSAQYRKPIALGVLTCGSEAQALARTGGETGNKGAEAMNAAIHMVHVLRAARNTRVPGGA